MKTKKDFEIAAINYLQEQQLGEEKINFNVLNHMLDFMYKVCLGELLPIDIINQQSELRLESYKEGFNAATKTIMDMNKVVQKEIL